MMYLEGAGFPFPTKITSLLGYLLSTGISGPESLRTGNKELTSMEVMIVQPNEGRGRGEEKG
jgi:hypothetical protein